MCVWFYIYEIKSLKHLVFLENCPSQPRNVYLRHFIVVTVFKYNENIALYWRYLKEGNPHELNSIFKKMVNKNLKLCKYDNGLVNIYVHLNPKLLKEYVFFTFSFVI